MQREVVRVGDCGAWWPGVRSAKAGSSHSGRLAPTLQFIWVVEKGVDVCVWITEGPLRTVYRNFAMVVWKKRGGAQLLM